MIKTLTNIQVKLRGYISNIRFIFFEICRNAIDICTKFHIIIVISVSDALDFLWCKNYSFPFCTKCDQRVNNEIALSLFCCLVFCRNLCLCRKEMLPSGVKKAANELKMKMSRTIIKLYRKKVTSNNSKIRYSKTVD